MWRLKLHHVCIQNAEHEENLRWAELGVGPAGRVQGELSADACLCVRLHVSGVTELYCHRSGCFLAGQPGGIHCPVAVTGHGAQVCRGTVPQAEAGARPAVLQRGPFGSRDIFS